MRDRVQLLERREVDELIILDIAATPNRRGPRFDEVAQLCHGLFMPVCVGGGVRSVEDVSRLLRSGADKISICTSALESPSLLSECAKKFGSQAVVAAIDVLKNGRVATECGKYEHQLGAKEWAMRLEDFGAGEILLTSIDRDGTLEGYDLDLIHEVSQAVAIPVVAAGGCGSYEHVAQAIKAGAHAAAVGAMFQFTESTPRGASRYLNERGIPAR